MELQHVATICLSLAVIHTFSVKQFSHLALKFREGSVAENFFHLLAEVEGVFGLWAGIFALYYLVSEGAQSLLSYLNNLNFTEPAFVFVIMAICSTRPIIYFANKLIWNFSRTLPLAKTFSFYVSTLILGPLLGSFITEPAAMTVTALILLESFFKKNVSQKFKYATLGLLFVNISIGGTLTPFAAPPVLMVASTWKWDLQFMLKNFGWKAALAVTASTFITAIYFRRELKQLQIQSPSNRKLPLWLTLLHVLFVGLVVATSHHMVAFVPLFLIFLGVLSVTKEYQSEPKLKEGLLVACFLGGLVILGGLQRWWLEPLLAQLEAFYLYVGATTLTAITDNAALTYLGSQIPTLTEASRYALVSGAVVGGGLTVIANAPNPAGYGVLNSSFGEEGISPLGLFIGALLPTTIAFLIFWFL